MATSQATKLYSKKCTCISLEEVDVGCSSVFSTMILELIHGEESLVLCDIEFLVCEEPVVILWGDLSERPDKKRVLVLNVVISSRVTCSI